ncbi:MAG TPA: DUF393 domain-containing protein [Gemmatimonadales bacterium]|nr:DUF393 domain-containing protein [Gemmatimonadales bacterium]
MLTPRPARPVLLYDGACGFCLRAIGWLRRWDRAGRIETLPMQRRAERTDLPPIADAALARAMHLVTPDGAVYAGGRAARAMLRWLPGGALLRPLFLIPGVPWVVNRTYEGVAARRHRLGCGGPSCSFR